MSLNKQLGGWRVVLCLIACVWAVPALASELTLSEGTESRTLSLDEIESSPLIHAELRHPEGPAGRFSGVDLDTLLADHGLAEADRVRFIAHDGYTTFLTPQQRGEKQYLFVTRLNGEPIALDDLGPFMLIVPDDVEAVREGTEPMTRWIWAIREVSAR